MIRVEDAEQAIGWYVRKLNYELFRREESTTSHCTSSNPRTPPTRRCPSNSRTTTTAGRTNSATHGVISRSADDLHGAWETLMERHAEDYRDPESCDDR